MGVGTKPSPIDQPSEAVVAASVPTLVHVGGNVLARYLPSSYILNQLLLLLVEILQLIELALELKVTIAALLS